ncbi:MAG TPA: hypothetical protein VD788_02865 [Candidatus Polarisedimenticolaceae bacterium]|nr:hypothetical protein [Candidatus Polarisedimenticolaceae bacterium]
MPGRRHRRVVPLLLVLTVATGLGPRAEPPADPPQTKPQETFTEWGRSTRTVVPPTEAGVWDGTWYYVSRDALIVLWMRTVEDQPQVKLQYRNQGTGEGFVTDWEGNADYRFREAEARFRLNVDRRDPYVITGRWDWQLDSGKGRRIEEGDYSIYRTGDGRFLVVDFADFSRRLESSAGPDRVAASTPSWTFTKASKRLVLWDELPF